MAQAVGATCPKNKRFTHQITLKSYPQIGENGFAIISPQARYNLFPEQKHPSSDLLSIKTIRTIKRVHSGNRFKPIHPSTSESPSETPATSIVDERITFISFQAVDPVCPAPCLKRLHPCSSGSFGQHRVHAGRPSSHG